MTNQHGRARAARCAVERGLAPAAERGRDAGERRSSRPPSRCRSDARRQAPADHRRGDPPQHRVGGGRAGPAGRGRGRADRFRPRHAGSPSARPSGCPSRRRARARREQPDDLARCARSSSSRWGGVDGVLHAIAFAPDDALGGAFLETPAESAAAGVPTSAFSLKALPAELAPLLDASEGSASWASTSTPPSPGPPTTGWASRRPRLEAVSRYLARDLGPRRRAREPRLRRAARDAGRRRHPRLRPPRRRVGRAGRRSAGTPSDPARSPRRCAFCSPTGRRPSAARSFTWTAASTRWPPRGRISCPHRGRPAAHPPLQARPGRADPTRRRGRGAPGPPRPSRFRPRGRRRGTSGTTAAP